MGIENPVPESGEDKKRVQFTQEEQFVLAGLEAIMAHPSQLEDTVDDSARPIPGGTGDDDDNDLFRQTQLNGDIPGELL